MNKDLKFIARHVTEWPDNPKATKVRLDEDGEICFEGGCGTGYDFYPEGGIFHFCGVCGFGIKYTKQQWLDARKYSHVLFHDKVLDLLEEEFGEREWTVTVQKVQGKFNIQIEEV